MTAAAWMGLFALVATAVPACAHNPDTSYAIVQIEPRRLATKLTYDLFTLNKIVSPDENHDHRISRAELEKHLPEILLFLERNITLEVSGEAEGLGKSMGMTWPEGAGEDIPESDYHSVASLVAFRFERPLQDKPEEVTVEFDFFERLGERHTVLGTWINSGVSEEVIFTRFEPDYLFDTGYVAPLWPRLQQFFFLGMQHIFHGFDHLCFLAALIVVARPWELFKIVTSFTVAHSITLILAAMEIVQLPGRWVESAIAATIVYVALENLRPTPPRHRAVLTFGFGLVHGFGFAALLQSMVLPTTGLVRCLLSFNVGVEVGQLAVVCALLPLALLLKRWQQGEKAVRIVSGLLAGMGGLWLIDRVFGLAWMPF